MWVKWTMTLVKLEGPLETDTWLLNESCSGLAWPPSPCTHFSSQILENRQRKTGNSQMQPLALAGKRRIFFFFALSQRYSFLFFFKGLFKRLQSRKPSTFFVLFWKKIPSSPQPPLDQGFKRGMYRSGFVRLSASRPIGDSGGLGAGEMGRGDLFPKPKRAHRCPTPS